jgi:hypothetical protein
VAFVPQCHSGDVMQNTNSITELENLNGAAIIAQAKDAIYLRIPRSLAKDIELGCSCDYCKAHPDKTPKWDTLCVPLKGSYQYACTVHMPDPKSFREYIARKEAEAIKTN